MTFPGLNGKTHTLWHFSNTEVHFEELRKGPVMSICGTSRVISRYAWTKPRYITHPELCACLKSCRYIYINYTVTCQQLKLTSSVFLSRLETCLRCLLIYKGQMNCSILEVSKVFDISEPQYTIIAVFFFFFRCTLLRFGTGLCGLGNSFGSGHLKLKDLKRRGHLIYKPRT